MPYRLKKEVEAFKVVDGPGAGVTYEHGRTYEEVPAREAHKFEQTGQPAPARAPKPKKGGSDE